MQLDSIVREVNELKFHPQHEPGGWPCLEHIVETSWSFLEGMEEIFQ